jgi:pimeloyl-ACP methyl ester carboxylesterase
VTSSPTFVLVHGGYHGGWCWDRVADRLRRRGARVLTPTQTGAGERVHQLAAARVEVFVQDVVGVLEAEELTDVTLVGHSFGGLSVTGAVDRVPERVRGVVYLDALLVEDGRTAFDVMPEQTVAQRRATAVDHDGVRCLAMAPASVFGVTDPADAAWLERRLTPHPIGLYDEPVHWANPIGNGRPCHYVAMTDPWYPPLASCRDYARSRTDWTWSEIATGHDAMISAPDLVADTLWAAAT